jgi:hypothetical protein
MDDPQTVTSENKAFRGINLADLQAAYRQFCKNENVPPPAVDLGKVIDRHNEAAADLPWRAAPQWDSRWDYGQRGRRQQPKLRRADPNSFWNYRR